MQTQNERCFTTKMALKILFGLPMELFSVRTTLNMMCRVRNNLNVHPGRGRKVEILDGADREHILRALDIRYFDGEEARIVQEWLDKINMDLYAFHFD